MYAKAEERYVVDPVPSKIGSRRFLVSQLSNKKEKSKPKQVTRCHPDRRGLVTQDTVQCEQKSFESALESPNVKRELDSKVSISNQFTTGDFTHQLLEEQCKQNQQMQELIKQQQKSVLALTLPEPKVPTFSGNPVAYWSFVRAFEKLIERKTKSESACLHYLVQSPQAK